MATFTRKFIAATIITAIAGTTGLRADAGQKDTSAPAIPTCDKKYGTLSVLEPQNHWWSAYGLESPEALLKVFVQESKCFTILDRGRGLDAARAERQMSANGDMRVGSNMGKGQMKAADYVLVPDISNQNSNAKGKNIGGFLGSRLGAVAGGLNLKTQTADVVLALTDVRSTEQVSLQQGHAQKTDLRMRGGGAAWVGMFAAAGASSYTNTEMGQVMAEAFLQAFVKMVEDVKASQPDAKANNVSQSVSMAKPGEMYVKADVKSTVVRELEVGMTLYPMGDKAGIWWKVSDDRGNEGWVPSPLFGLAK